MNHVQIFKHLDACTSHEQALQFLKGVSLYDPEAAVAIADQCNVADFSLCLDAIIVRDTKEAVELAGEDEVVSVQKSDCGRYVSVAAQRLGLIAINAVDVEVIQDCPINLIAKAAENALEQVRGIR